MFAVVTTHTLSILTFPSFSVPGTIRRMFVGDSPMWPGKSRIYALSRRELTEERSFCGQSIVLPSAIRSAFKTNANTWPGGLESGIWNG